MSAETEEKYQDQLSHFTTTYLYEPAYTCVEYIQNTWLKPGRKESLVAAWVNKYPHFGITVTSR